MRNLTDALMTPAAPAVADEGGNSFSRGLRQGMTAAGGQLHALAGGVSEALGAQDFAQQQYAQAKAAEELAATQAPAVTDWRQVTQAPDLSTGLRNAGSYVAGLAGQAVPLVGLGLGAAGAAALTRGAVSPLLAGTAAVAPFETGGALQRQQADPAVMANNSAVDRLGTAALEGTGRALAMNAVPQLMGGKLLGAGVGAASKAGILAEGVGGNALAGAAAEKISTTAEDHLNPNRDTSNDDTRMLDAAVAGGALGVPFAGVGLVGHALHGKAEAPAGRPIKEEAPAPAPTAEAPTAPPASLVDRIRNTFVRGDDAAEKIAAGKDVIDVDALRAAPPEKQGEMLRAADDARVETTKGWVDELMKDGALSEENRAKLAQAANDLSDRTNQAIVAGVKLAQEGTAKLGKLTEDFFNAASKKRTEDTGEGTPLKSEVADGADRAIADVVAPHIGKQFPQLNDTALQSVTTGLRRVMDHMQKTGTVDPDVAGHLQKLFGADTTNVLTQLHERVLGDADKDATNNYFRAVNKLDGSMSTQAKLTDKIREALPDKLKASATPDQIDQMAKHLQEYVSGATLDGKTPEQRIAMSRQIESALREHFGDHTDDLLETAKLGLETERAQDALHAEERRASPDELNPDDIEYAPPGEDGLAYHEDAGITSDLGTRRDYYSANKDEPVTFTLSDAAHRQKYGNDASAYARIVQKMQADYPDRAVRAVSARQYARENLMSDEQLRAMTKGDPDNHVAVLAEDANHGALGWRDVDRLKLDTHKYPDSPSRIDLRVGENENVKIDALKLTRMFAPEHMLARDEHDVNPMRRLQRQFSEGLAALADHLGTDEPLHVPDETVIAYRDGKPVTWGEVQKAGSVKPDEGMRRLQGLYDAREAAVKMGDAEELRSIDAKLSSRVLRDNDPGDELVDGMKKRPGGSHALAVAAERLGAVSNKLKAEIDKRGPLRDETGRVLRAPSMRENVLKHEYSEAMKNYERAEEQLARRREGGELHDKSNAVRKAGDSEGDFTSLRSMESGSWGGATEIAPDAQVHLAAAEHSDALGNRFAASRNMEAGPEGNLLHADNFEPDTHFDGRLPAEIKGAISSRAATLAAGKSAVQRALGKKVQHLLGVIDQMRIGDQAELAAIVKDKDTASVSSTINDLYRKYGSLTPEQPKSNFVNRVVGKGDVNDVIRAMKVSDDTRGLQRAVDALLPHQHDTSARAVLEVANERLGKLIEAHPDIAYSMQRMHPGNSTTSGARLPVKEYIEKVLGKTVDVEFAKLLHAGEFLNDPTRTVRGLNADVIRVSTHSLDPMSVGYHEALHAFFAKLHDTGLLDDAHPLEKAASSPRVVKQLKDLLAGEPDALKQLDDPHERAAYMFQFWAAGKLKLQPRPDGILGHVADFFRKTLGIWTNDARAEHIMQYFHSGEYGKEMRNRSAVARVLAEGSNAHVEKFKDMVAPLGKLATAVAATGDARLRSTGVDALGKLADKVYAPLHGEHGDDPGYLPAARAKRGEFMNRLGTELGQHDAGIVSDALESLQRGLKGATPAERRAVASIRKVLDDSFLYMRDAGVDIAPLGFGKDYFPRVWDANTILRNKDEFRDMLQKYVSTGQFKGSVDQVIATLTRTDGSDLQVETIRPGMQSSKERVLQFIEHRDAAPFLNKNLYETLNSYITQATRRAEWARRFKDDSSELHRLMSEAEKQGATKDQLQLASDYLQGVDGTLGDSIDPKLRRAFGNAIVYQNLRLLPLAIFSSVIDPMGILVRGGSMRDTFAAMKRGFAEMPKNFRKDAKSDSWTDLAAQLGVIDNAVLMHNLGTSFSQGMTSTWGRKLNDTFFKYNLMEQYNTSMRVAATQAAVGFLARHADGTASTHSPRWLAELGFKPNEIRVKNGQPLMTAREFEAADMAPDKAQAAADKMTLAINKWVDGAILRPNAAHKPIWMNDPHFALLAHLKQFVYSFQETILKRVANEVRFGNIGPAYALAGYVPFMLAADTIKGMLVGGGDQPDWKKGWDASDYLFYEVQRAGLFGVGQFGVDAAKDVYRGGLGVGALVGPTIEQLGEAARTVGGAEQFKTFALNAMPANALFDAAGNASAATNAVD
jgi:hypothetical protein